MTNGKLTVMAAVVALAAVLAAACYDGVCDRLAASDDEARFAAERRRAAAEQDRDLAELRAVGADAAFAEVAAAVARAEQGLLEPVAVSADLARARQVFPADDRGRSLHARYVALRTRRHRTPEGAAATLAYLQAIGLP
jgi:hypothetical protein